MPSTTNHRRERGYAFEKHIVDFFNKARFNQGWQARRLGGSSTGLPDVVITNNDNNIIFALEAKSTVGTTAYIPNDQICRCLDILDMFSIYQQKNVVFAFKFAKSKSNSKLRYYFFRVDNHPSLRAIKTFKCGSIGYIELRRMVEDIEIKFKFNRYEDLDDLKDFQKAFFSHSL